MKDLIGEMRRAHEAGLFYLALLLALTMPNICAALQEPNGKATGKKYRNWAEKHFTHKYLFLTPQACWELRCGALHEGTFSRDGAEYSRVVFMLPNEENTVADDCLVGDGLFLHLSGFCQRMDESVTEWWTSMADNVVVRENSERLIQYRPNGYPPFVSGYAVIA